VLKPGEPPDELPMTSRPRKAASRGGGSFADLDLPGIRRFLVHKRHFDHFAGDTPLVIRGSHAPLNTSRSPNSLGLASKNCRPGPDVRFR
jgi:hypothetical protein